MFARVNNLHLHKNTHLPVSPCQGDTGLLFNWRQLVSYSYLIYDNDFIFVLYNFMVIKYYNLRFLESLIL